MEKSKSENSEGGKAEVLKGMRKVDVIVPKLPLIDPTTQLRQDGRTLSEIRPLCKLIIFLIYPKFSGESCLLRYVYF